MIVYFMRLHISSTLLQTYNCSCLLILKTLYSEQFHWKIWQASGHIEIPIIHQTNRQPTLNKIYGLPIKLHGLHQIICFLLWHKNKAYHLWYICLSMVHILFWSNKKSLTDILTFEQKWRLTFYLRLGELYDETSFAWSVSCKWMKK